MSPRPLAGSTIRVSWRLCDDSILAWTHRSTDWFVSTFQRGPEMRVLRVQSAPPLRTTSQFNHSRCGSCVHSLTASCVKTVKTASRIYYTSRNRPHFTAAAACSFCHKCILFAFGGTTIQVLLVNHLLCCHGMVERVWHRALLYYVLYLCGDMMIVLL